MKFFNLFIFALLPLLVNSFKNVQSITNRKTNLKAIQFGGTTPYKVSFSKLIENIENDKVDDIYFSEDLRKIYTKTENDEELPISTITSSNPVLANKIIELNLYLLRLNLNYIRL